MVSSAAFSRSFIAENQNEISQLLGTVPPRIPLLSMGRRLTPIATFWIFEIS